MQSQNYPDANSTISTLSTECSNAVSNAPDLLFEAVHEMIIRMYLDFGHEQLANKLRSATAASWTEHLRKKGVGWAQVQMIYADAVTLKASAGNNFMPTIADLLTAWKIMIEGGYWDEVNKPSKLPALPPPPHNPNTPGFRIFQMSRLRLAAGKDTVSCDCVDADGYGIIAGITSDGEFLCCEKRQCNFRWKAERFMEARVHSAWRPMGNAREGVEYANA